jgi:hypothetical protein
MSAEFVSIRNGHYRENWVATELGRLPPVSQDPRVAASDFSTAQVAASMVEGQHASVPMQTPLMQINAHAV